MLGLEDAQDGVVLILLNSRQERHQTWGASLGSVWVLSTSPLSSGLEG